MVKTWKDEQISLDPIKMPNNSGHRLSASSQSIPEEFKTGGA